MFVLKSLCHCRTWFTLLTPNRWGDMVITFCGKLSRYTHFLVCRCSNFILMLIFACHDFFHFPFYDTAWRGDKWYGSDKAGMRHITPWNLTCQKLHLVTSFFTVILLLMLAFFLPCIFFNFWISATLLALKCNLQPLHFGPKKEERNQVEGSLSASCCCYAIPIVHEIYKWHYSLYLDSWDDCMLLSLW